MKKFLVLSLLCSLLFLITGTTYATDGSGIGITPAYPDHNNDRSRSIYVHTLEPGQVQDEGVEVVNNSDVQKTVVLSSTDSLLSSGGAFGCRQSVEPKTDVGSWVTFPENTFTLQPSERRVVPFQITVPLSASVGENNGCITLEEQKPVSTNEGVTLSFRSAIRLAVTIPGTIVRSLSLSQFQIQHIPHGGRLAQLILHNDGNVSIDSDVTVTVKNIFGTVLHTNQGQFPILRSSDAEFNFDTVKPFFGGFYKAAARVSYDKGSRASIGVSSGQDPTILTAGPVWFFVPPTIMGLVFEILVLLFVLSLILLLVARSRHKKAHSKKSVPKQTSHHSSKKPSSHKTSQKKKLS